MLGLGHSLVAGSSLDSAYAMASAFDFDGTNDGFLTNTVNAQSPADGTLKPLTTSMSVAVWVRLDDVSGSFYDQSGDQNLLVVCQMEVGHLAFKTEDLIVTFP